MKKSVLLFVLFVGLQSIAQAGVEAQCVPEDSTHSVKSVVLNRDEDYHYTLTLQYADRVESAAAEYYDDMTYFGYGSEILGAAIEFDYPREPQWATLILNWNRVTLICQK